MMIRQQMIRQQTFSIHINRGMTMCLKFAERMKFTGENNGQMEIYSKSGEYICGAGEIKKQQQLIFGFFLSIIFMFLLPLKMFCFPLYFLFI